MNPLRILRAATLALIAGAALTACTLGPNFEAPASTVPPVFARTQTLQAPSQPVAAAFNADWWTLFDDPVLNALEQRLADANLDVAAASARLRQSRAERRVAGAAELPTLAAAGSYDRERGSENGILSLLGVTPSAAPTQSASGGTPFGVAAAAPGSSGSPAYNLYQAGFDASWELDLWGRVRRGVEAADALTQASYEARNAVLLSARAELARDYLELRDAQAQLRIARQNLAIARDLEKLVRIRRKDGVTTDLDVANAAAQVASIESRLPMLESRRATRANAIGVLLAQPPGALDPILDAPHAVPGFRQACRSASRPSWRNAGRHSSGRGAAACGNRRHRRGAGRLLSAHHAERQRRFPEPPAVESRQLGVGSVRDRAVDLAADLRGRAPDRHVEPAPGTAAGSRDRLSAHRARSMARGRRCAGGLSRRTAASRSTRRDRDAEPARARDCAATVPVRCGRLSRRAQCPAAIVRRARPAGD